MAFLDTLISRISEHLCCCLKLKMGVLNYLKIMTFSIANMGTDHRATRVIYDHLSLECVTLLFSGVKVLLLFLGRSIGDSVASTKTTS